MKRTYQPGNTRRTRKHGFRKVHNLRPLGTPGRRAKGRSALAFQYLRSIRLTEPGDRHVI